MLGKLLKHEMKATARIFLPMIGALAIFSVINKFLYSDMVSGMLLSGYSSWLSSILYFISSTIYGLLIAAAFVATFIVLLQRFYRNLLKDEGYLMFTLPVKPWQHIAVKTINSGIWGFINGAVAFFSILFLSGELPQFFRGWGEFWSEFGWMCRDAGISTVGAFLELILLFLVLLFGSMLPVFASISIGQLWKNHRVLGAVGAYIALILITQTLVSVGITLWGEVFLVQISSAAAVWHTILVTCIVSLLFFFAVCFVATNLILSKRLDLE